MARYFFHVHDGVSIVDTVGSEHADLASVRREAVEGVSQRLHNSLLENSDSMSWLMNVTGEDNVTVLLLSFSAAVRVVSPPLPTTDI